jgi:hypothetical protein
MERTMATKRIPLEGLSHAELLTQIQDFLEEHIGSMDSVEIRIVKEEKSVNAEVDMSFTSSKLMF